MVNYSFSIQADWVKIIKATWKLYMCLMYNPYTPTTSLCGQCRKKNASSKVIKIQWACVCTQFRLPRVHLTRESFLSRPQNYTSTNANMPRVMCECLVKYYHKRHNALISVSLSKAEFVNWQMELLQTRPWVEGKIPSKSYLLHPHRNHLMKFMLK